MLNKNTCKNIDKLIIVLLDLVVWAIPTCIICFNDTTRKSLPMIMSTVYAIAYLVYALFEAKYKKGNTSYFHIIANAILAIIMSSYIYYSTIGVYIIQFGALILTSFCVLVHSKFKKIDTLKLVNSSLVVLCIWMLVLRYFIIKYYSMDFELRTEKCTVVLGLFCTFIIASTIISYSYTKIIKTENLFIMLSLILGFFYLTVLPPMSAPDEECHFAMAYSYSNVILGGKRTIGEAGTRENGNGCMFYYIPARSTDAIYIRENYDFEYVWQYPNFTNYTDCIEGLDNFSGYEKQFNDVFIGRFTNASIIVYLPAVLGITLARVLGFGSMQLIFIGRIFNYLFFCFCGYYAIKKIPFAKKAFLVALFMPMTLHLAASYSYDSVLIASSYLLVAYSFYLIYKKQTITWRDILVLTTTVLFVSSAKVFYSFIALLLLLIPVQKYKCHKDKIVVMLCIFLCACIGIISSSLSGIQGYINSENSTTYYTLSYCLGHIEETLFLFINSIIQCAEYYYGTMVGYLLGWLDFRISYFIVILFSVLIFIGSIESYDVIPDTKCTSVCLIIASLITTCILLTTILWTPIGDEIVSGFQGRYLIEAFPLVLIFTQKVNNHFSTKNNNTNLIGTTVFILNTLCLLTVFNAIAIR